MNREYAAQAMRTQVYTSEHIISAHGSHLWDIPPALPGRLNGGWRESVRCEQHSHHNLLNVKRSKHVLR